MKKLGDAGSRAKRRIRRGALPSSLMGLVAFSFTLLAFSAIAYTSSLPALVMARSRVGEEGLFSAVARALVGHEPADAPADSAEADASSRETEADGDEGGHPLGNGGFTLGGVSLQGVMGQVVGKPDQGQGGDQGDSGTQKPDGGDDGAKPDGGGSGGGDGGSGDGAGGDQRPPTPEEERMAYEFLLGHAQAIDGYVVKANACVDAFNSDCLAELATRKAHKSTCYALQTDLFYNRYDVLVNKAPIHNDSKYRKAHGDLISMYRCLLAYVGTLDEAWEINVGFEDPASHVGEFMGPINSATENGENIHLAEFKRYYEGFVL